MKILFVNTLYEPFAIGGAEKVCKMLAEGLISRDHEIRILTTLPRGVERIEEQGGIQIHYFPVRNIYRPFGTTKHGLLAKAAWHMLDSFNLLMRSAVAKEIAAWAPDILHTHNLTGFSPAIWSAATAQRVPIVHTLHDYYLLCPKSSMYKDGRRCNPATRCAQCKLYAWPKIRATRHVAAAVGVSRFICDRHLELGCFPRALHRSVIHNPVAEKAPHQTHFVTPKRTLRLGFLGQVAPHKGIETLLAAWRSLPPGIANLWIAGTGDQEYVSHLRSSQDSLNGLHWMGFSLPEDLLSKIDILVIPSDWEDPAPLVVVEAMMHGVPVLGSARGGIPELLGEGGWIYDGSAASLASRVRTLSSNPNEIGERAALAVARAHDFSLQASVDAYERLYRNVAHNAINNCSRPENSPTH